MTFSINTKKFLIAFVILFCVLGIGMRLYRINHSDFIFYDEGYYLNYNIYFYDLLEKNFPNNWPNLRQAIGLWFRVSLGCGKALWFLLSDVRVFFGGYRAWFFPRILSACAGIAAIGMIYLFAWRFYRSRPTAILSAVLLAILPSHVFYSRLAFQESLSTLFFLLGFYFYLFPRRFSWRTFISATCFAGAYFTNYRLIILPVHIIFCELFLSIFEKRSFEIRKLVWHLTTWLAYVVIIGALDKGQNTIVTFAWMFYQSSLAEKQFHWINFLSYPYYLFRLEHLLFGLLFFGNVYYLKRKKNVAMFPFCLAGLHMLMYSFAAEKAARYICVVIPFVVMAVASMIVFIYQEKSNKSWQTAVVLAVAIMLAGLMQKSWVIATSRSDYRQAVACLASRDKDFKAVATQNFIMNLYVPNRKQVEPFPHKFRTFLEYYQRGYRYLIVDPQAYVSFTDSTARFTLPLHAYLGFIEAKVKPIKVFKNFNNVLLERFVFDHNENLSKAIAFLNENPGTYGQIRIYDMQQCLLVMDKLIGLKKITEVLTPGYTPSRPSDEYGR